MKRKSKKTPKTKGERTPTESDKASSEGEPSTSKQIKTESFEPQEQVNNIDAETEASSNSNKSIESIKLEKIDDSQSLGSDVATEEKKSNSLSSESNSVCDMSSVEETFLFVELKLISIDQSCLEYKKLTQNFLCVNSNAQVDHLKKLIVKKMGFPEDLYDIVLMCNGFEVKSGCPLIFLKNKFFPKEEKLIIYYAIVEQERSLKECFKVETTTQIDVK